MIRFAFLAFLVLLGPSNRQARSQEEKPNPKFLQGTHALRAILKLRGYQPITDLDLTRIVPQNTLIIVLGQTDVLDEALRFAQEFVQRGGALLVATDRGVVRRRALDWTSEFGVEFVGQPVLGDPDRCYQGIERCPWIVETTRNRFPLFQNLRHRAATNCSGFLRIRRSSLGRMLSSVAILSPDAQSVHAAEILERRGTFIFAAAGNWNDGKVLFLADHSIFINNMMLQPDTGNIGFTYNCLDWLSSGGAARRDQVLLIDDGQVVTDFNVPMVVPPLALPDVDNPVTLFNQLVTGLEQENMHNRLLLEAIGYRRLLKWIVIALTTLLVLFGLFRLMRSRFRTERAAPLLEPALRIVSSPGAGMASRQSALLASRNLWEPASALARDFYEEALPGQGITDQASPPAFESSDSWLSRRILEKLLRHLWRLAQGTSPERITPEAFAHLVAQLDELKAAVADGSLRFQTPTA